VPQSKIESFDLYPGPVYPGYATVRSIPPPGPATGAELAPVTMPTSPPPPDVISVTAPRSEGEPLPVAMEPAAHMPEHSWQPCISTGVRAWFSWADSERSHGGPGPLFNIFADDLSVLRWKRMSSEVIEANVNTLWFDRVLLNAELGTGAISSGQFRDQDFAVSGQQLLFSDTIHPAMDDDLLYVNIDLGWRFCECDYFVFDALVGYQFWRETYVAEGGASIVPPGPPFPAGPVITEQFTWEGFRIGCQSVFLPEPRCVIKTRIMFMPFTHFENEDVHHLRTDLAQDPSGIDTAAGGFGVRPTSAPPTTFGKDCTSSWAIACGMSARARAKPVFVSATARRRSSPSTAPTPRATVYCSASAITSKRSISRDRHCARLPNLDFLFFNAL